MGRSLIQLFQILDECGDAALRFCVVPHRLLNCGQAGGKPAQPRNVMVFATRPKRSD
jgi:hypothetical protein